MSPVCLKLCNCVSYSFTLSDQKYITTIKLVEKILILRFIAQKSRKMNVKSQGKSRETQYVLEVDTLDINNIKSYMANYSTPPLT